MEKQDVIRTDEYERKKEIAQQTWKKIIPTLVEVEWEFRKKGIEIFIFPPEKIDVDGVLFTREEFFINSHTQDKE